MKKKYPLYWLRGGLIGVLIALIVLLLNNLFPSYLIYLLLFKLSSPLINIYYLFPDLYPFFFSLSKMTILELQIIVRSSLIILNLFLIGILLGWIYGKTKKSKRI